MVINDDRIFNKYFKEISKDFKRQLSDITEVVIHGTGGGKSARGIIRWMLGGERTKQYKRGIALFHVEIDRNGDVYNLISPSYWCYHSSSGKHDKCTMGIELVNPGIENTDGYTLEQYEALMNLLNQFKAVFPINIICGHGYNKQKYSKKYKNCPGENFKWEFLEEIGCKKIENECYKA